MLENEKYVKNIHRFHWQITVNSYICQALFLSDVPCTLTCVVSNPHYSALSKISPFSKENLIQSKVDSVMGVIFEEV